MIKTIDDNQVLNDVLSSWIHTLELLNPLIVDDILEILPLISKCLDDPMSAFLCAKFLLIYNVAQDNDCVMVVQVYPVLKNIIMKHNTDATSHSLQVLLHFTENPANDAFFVKSTDEIIDLIYNVLERSRFETSYIEDVVKGTAQNLLQNFLPICDQKKAQTTILKYQKNFFGTDKHCREASLVTLGMLFSYKTPTLYQVAQKSIPILIKVLENPSEDFYIHDSCVFTLNRIFEEFPDIKEDDDLVEMVLEILVDLFKYHKNPELFEPICSALSRIMLSGEREDDPVISDHLLDKYLTESFEIGFTKICNVKESFGELSFVPVGDMLSKFSKYFIGKDVNILVDYWNRMIKILTSEIPEDEKKQQIIAIAAVAAEFLMNQPPIKKFDVQLYKLLNKEVFNTKPIDGIALASIATMLGWYSNEEPELMSDWDMIINTSLECLPSGKQEYHANIILYLNHSFKNLENVLNILTLYMNIVETVNMSSNAWLGAMGLFKTFFHNLLDELPIEDFKRYLMMIAGESDRLCGLDLLKDPYIDHFYIFTLQDLTAIAVDCSLVTYDLAPFIALCAEFIHRQQSLMYSLDVVADELYLIEALIRLVGRTKFSSTLLDLHKVTIFGIVQRALQSQIPEIANLALLVSQLP